MQLGEAELTVARLEFNLHIFADNYHLRPSTGSVVTRCEFI